MKLIAIRTDTADQGEFVFTSIQEAVAKQRSVLDDVALVGPGEKGVEVTHSKGRFGRMFGSGIDDGNARRLYANAPAGSTLVLALGDEDEVDAVAARTRTLTDGEMHTFDVVGDELHETTGVEATYEVTPEEDALLEEPSLGEGDLPRNRLDRP